MRFTFPYCVNPWVINQPWGVYDPKIYSQFGFTNHNGTDVALGADKTIYAPFSGTVVRYATKENGLWQPNGGGIFISILSDSQYAFDDGQICYVLADFLHCERLLVQDGSKVEQGKALAIADNTGFSSGPHTHIQLRREFMKDASPETPASFRYFGTKMLEDVDRNNANNSFDPTPYYTKEYVPDKISLLKTALDLCYKLLVIYKGRNKQNP